MLSVYTCRQQPVPTHWDAMHSFIALFSFLHAHIMETVLPLQQSWKAAKRTHYPLTNCSSALVPSSYCHSSRMEVGEQIQTGTKATAAVAKVCIAEIALHQAMLYNHSYVAIQVEGNTTNERGSILFTMRSCTEPTIEPKIQSTQTTRHSWIYV